MKYSYNSRYTTVLFSLSAVVCMSGSCGKKKPQTLSQRLEAVSQGKLKNSIIQYIKQSMTKGMNEQLSKEGMKEKLPEAFMGLLESIQQNSVDTLIMGFMPKIEEFIKSFQEICRAELSPQKLECVIGKLEQQQSKFENMFETFKEAVPEHVSSKVEKDFSMILVESTQ
ncbi:MAG: hypothetical protein NMK33_03715 [Candidatus Cardinium sp.]|uniref:hypothetical protein n=1 Tax=Cardinium endosymbiont of Dermatophagoides farinae TaxID=2597823 RepID=UPI001181FFD4|nr:hypothetical protein [Cardinium endosymbiont of Dermatophagoides farinae]TSJ80560.1 hypothetical protein FPG78_00475 [Cardinium endosymbiont of Dermatophagoides farinae]UWW96539.1 MAG: hypothetical protein NMK33_03715 [Candidatus Cardinium sp.]